MTHIAGVCVSVSRCVSGPVAHAESWALTLLLTPNGARNADKREGLTNTPAALVQYGERTIRAAGRPDVERIWRSQQNHEK